MNRSPKTYRYLLMTVDPVHIGTGGTRLGRVDLSIVREPGTRLPKIPGSSLHGVIRTYAAHRYGKPRCAGQGQSGEGREGHCGQPTCPICYTFGAVTGERSYAGVVSIGDARLLLFPVYSMAGPVWVTSPSTLSDFGIPGQSVADDKAKWSNGITTQNYLNLGWLMVERDEDVWTPPDKLIQHLPDPIKKRVVLVSDKLFSKIINSNLEVRTSVSINPETGAAEEGALFTYEAIPRATLLWMDVVVDDFRGAFPSGMTLEKWLEALSELPDAFPSDEREGEKVLRLTGLLQRKRPKPSASVEEKQRYWDEIKSKRKRLIIKIVREMSVSNKAESRISWVQMEGREGIVAVVRDGLKWAEHLGVGGMGTRGFGRIRNLGEISPDFFVETDPGQSDNRSGMEG